MAIINGRLSERSYRGYRRLGRLLWPLLERVDLVAAQNDEFAARFRALGCRSDAVHVTGSIKFDGAEIDRANKATVGLRRLAGFAESDIVFLAGSTQQPEEALRSRPTKTPRGSSAIAAHSRAAAPRAIL